MSGIDSSVIHYVSCLVGMLLTNVLSFKSIYSVTFTVLVYKLYRYFICVEK